MRLIDADALKERIRRFLSIKSLDDLLPEEKAIVQHIDRMPTADVVPVVHGRWNCSDDVYESAVCSCCGWDTTEPWVHIKEWFQFCPHCGARMDGKGNGNEAD